MSARPLFLGGRRQIDFGDTEGHTQPAVTHCLPLPIVTRPSLLARAWRWVRCAWLRWQIQQSVDFVQACARNGITDGVTLREIRCELEVMRCRLAQLESGH